MPFKEDGDCGHDDNTACPTPQQVKHYWSSTYNWADDSCNKQDECTNDNADNDAVLTGAARPTSGAGTAGRCCINPQPPLPSLAFHYKLQYVRPSTCPIPTPYCSSSCCYYYYYCCYYNYPFVCISGLLFCSYTRLGWVPKGESLGIMGTGFSCCSTNNVKAPKETVGEPMLQ